MNKPEFESILKQARLPEIPEASLEMFPRRVVASIQRGEKPSHPARHPLSRRAWAFGLVACVALVFAIGRWSGQMETLNHATNDSLASMKLVHETLALFPNRVRAIVQDGQSLNLVLSDNEDVPVSPPIFVRICDGRRCSSMVTFSGQEIQIAGQKMTVLSDARGGIILTGNQFVWSNTERTYAGNHLKIKAKNLGALVM